MTVKSCKQDVCKAVLVSRSLTLRNFGSDWAELEVEFKWIKEMAGKEAAFLPTLYSPISLLANSLLATASAYLLANSLETPRTPRTPLDFQPPSWIWMRESPDVEM